MDWHYAIGEDQFGPVSADELRQLVQSGKVQTTDLAWCPAMAKWQEISLIRVLKISKSATPRASASAEKMGGAGGGKIKKIRGSITGIGGIC